MHSLEGWNKGREGSCGLIGRMHFCGCFHFFFGKDDWANPTCDGVLTLVVRFAVDRGANPVETAKPPTRLFFGLTTCERGLDDNR